jgi:O-methyltransferase
MTQKQEKRYTMLPLKAVKILTNTVLSSLEGKLVIAGTAHGGDVMAIREAIPSKEIIVIDSFEGLNHPTDDDPINAAPKGSHNNGGVQQYLSNFKEAQINPPDKIYKMWIDSENIKQVIETNISMVFLDLDHYQPVKACLEYFWPQLPIGGIILTHDFAFHRTTGVVKACEEFKTGWQKVRGFGKLIK